MSATEALVLAFPVGAVVGPLLYGLLAYAPVIAGTVWATCNERATSAREWRGER